MKNLKKITAAVASLVLFANIANAQTAIPTSYQVNEVANNATPFAVKYIGSDDEYVLFEVSVKSSNPADAKFQLTDSEEGALYSAGFKTGTVKTIKIEKREGQVLNFTLLLDHKIYSKSFSVSTSEVENTLVSENDITKL
ncbi:MAG: hypothetical protein ABJB11_15000 [Ferruginibacter sp.]